MNNWLSVALFGSESSAELCTLSIVIPLTQAIMPTHEPRERSVSGDFEV